MFHVALRQFPHNLNRFNVTEQELRALLTPWIREQPLELGERKWSPHQAKLTVLEGPRLEVQQLSMGRGWRAAQRQSEDVTERVLAAARRAQQARPPAASAPLRPADPLALGVELATLLGDEPSRLLAAWREARARSPSLAPSESLAAAEEALRSVAKGPDRQSGR